MSVYAQEMKVASGTLPHFADFKSKYVQSRNVHVWLPEGYSEKEQYAVLPSSLTHKIYFDYGDQTLDALYEPFQK